MRMTSYNGVRRLSRRERNSMGSYRTVVSSKGQMIIPAQLRRRLRLRKGTPLILEETPHGFEKNL